MRGHTARTASIFSVLVALALLAGCGNPAAVEFEPSGGAYDPASIENLLANADAGAAGEVTTEEAPSVRQEALVELRKQGDDASGVADLLTRGFPQDTAAIPILVEAASFEGTPVWVIVEAWGDPEGKLEHRRAWVFGQETGDLLYTASRR